MDTETNVTPPDERESVWTTATPFSKYLAMALFVALPFIGGWVGYQFAPVKVVEIEKVNSLDTPKVDQVQESGQSPDAEYTQEQAAADLRPYLLSPSAPDNTYSSTVGEDTLTFTVENSIMVYKPDDYMHFMFARKESPGDIFAQIFAEHDTDLYGNNLCHLEYCDLLSQGRYQGNNVEWNYLGKINMFYEGENVDAIKAYGFSIKQGTYNVYFTTFTDPRTENAPLNGLLETMEISTSP